MMPLGGAGINPWLRAADIVDPPAIRGKKSWREVARPEQLAPEGDWFVWLIRSGRGWGKSRTGVERIDERVRGGKTSRQVLIGGRTPSDVRDYLLNGPGGLLTHHPDIQYLESKRLLIWPNGVEGIIRSGANPEEFRGFSGSDALLDEFAAWDYPEECYSNMTLGMREGNDPQVVITTTPRPLKILKEIMAAPSTRVTVGRSYDNAANLSERWVRDVLDPLKGTRKGRQEVDGEVLEDVEGALWNLSTIDRHRVKPEDVPPMVRIVIGVDPQGIKKLGAETGIFAGGLAANGHYYMLEDGSINGSPAEWGARAVALYERHQADVIVGEINYGGEMVELTIKTVSRAAGFKMVNASRGKRQRAEPISSLYDSGLVHHVGTFPAAEDEMISFTPFTTASPNRMDALVWVLTELSADQPKKLNKITWGS